MKITIIRHAEVDMKWQEYYTSKTFDQACWAYDKSKIKPVENIKKDIFIEKVYISELSRTYETACELFSCKEFDMTELLNEVPLRSFKDTQKSYPLKTWNVCGRLQWFFNIKRQQEGRRKTTKRAKKAVAMIERKGKDCYVVTHGFFMITLIKVLRRNGYRIEREKKNGINNLEKVIAYKK